MDKNLNELISSATNVYKDQLKESQKFVRKWEPTGLLEGLTHEYEKTSMAVLLENQAKELVQEISSTGTTGNSEEWSGIALPLVRRIFAEIAAKEFVSVQPMSLPSGLVFFLEFRYGTAQPGFTTTSGSSGKADTVFGITNQSGEPSEGLYGAGRYGYSFNDYTKTGLSCASASATWADVDFSPTLSASIAGTPVVYKVTVDMSSTNYDINAVRSFYISGSTINAYYPQYTRAVDTTGAASTTYVTFLVSGSGTTCTGGVKYSKQPTATGRGDFEATSDPAYTDAADQSIHIPEIKIDLRSEPIVAKTRKLKAMWTPEFAQDLMKYHSIDAESELTGVLSEYVTMEIDLEILDMLINNALTTDYWSARIGQEYQQTTTPWFGAQDSNQGYSSAYTQMTWFQTLGYHMQKMSNTIHKKTMRGGANFAVMSPDVASIVESIPGYAADTDGNKMQFAMGVQKTGMINNRYTVYKNPYMQENAILMGFRGTQFLETGAAYCPYIPLIMTPLIYDPTNLTPRKGIMTRYAKKILRPEFYGKIYVTHMNFA